MERRMKVALGLLGLAVAWAAVVFVVVLGRRSSSDAAPSPGSTASAQAARLQERARQEAEDDATLRKVIAMESAERDRAVAEIDALWKKYDAGAKGKAPLIATMKKGLDIVDTVRPPGAQQQARLHNAAAARRRMAPLFNADARAEGGDADVLVPSPDRAKCIVLGSSWGNDGDTADAAASLGFKRILCRASFAKNPMTGQVVESPERAWDLSPLRRPQYPPSRLVPERHAIDVLRQLRGARQAT